MPLSKIYSNRSWLSVFLLFGLLGCAKVAPKDHDGIPLPTNKVAIAVFPVENETGIRAPMKQIQREIINELERKGFKVASPSGMDDFLFRNRIRYIAGMDDRISRKIREELMAETALFVRLELYDEFLPPKIALAARVVSAGPSPQILWADSVALSGDDAPGLLDLGLIKSPDVLRKKALDRIVSSLKQRFGRGMGGEPPFSSRKIDQEAPRSYFQSSEFVKKKRYRVAVLPFYNFCDRKKAGDILMENVVNRLVRQGNWDVVEPGIVRSSMLRNRIAMEDGISLASSDLVFADLKTDLIVTGKIFYYQDYKGFDGTTRVDFSLEVIEGKSRQVVFSSRSSREGDKRVWWFGIGRIKTAHELCNLLINGILSVNGGL